jgi:hypothetical protein
MREGSVNRMAPVEGEGAEAIAHIGEYITKQLEDKGFLPGWKVDLREHFNREEYKPESDREAKADAEDKFATAKPAAKPPVQASPAKKPPAVTPRGEPIGWEEALNHGNEWLNTGGNINNVINDFRKTGKLDGWDIGRMRAHLDRLRDATNKAGDDLRQHPKDLELQQKLADADRKEKRFEAAYKPMEAVGKATMPSLQGIPPLDERNAASTTGLMRRWKDFHEHPMTARDEIEAKSIADKAGKANDEYMKANGDLIKTLDDEYKKVKTDRKAPPTLADIGRTFAPETLKEVC